MRILVTGASGRVGSAIYGRLRLDGHDVVGLDTSPCSVADVVASILDEPKVRAAMAGAQAVVHTAALHAPHVDHRTEAEFEAINVGGTEVLVRLAREAGVERFVFTSTTALYGAGEGANGCAAWVDEDTRARPRTIYHRTKVAAEDLLEREAAKGGLSITSLRMSRCFPEPASLMAAYRLHRGVDARDVADAHAAALNEARPGYRRYVISGKTPFHRGDGTALFEDAPALLARKVPALVAEFTRRGWKLPASIDRVYDSSRAIEELGWQPRHGFVEVLAQLDRRSLEVLPDQGDRESYTSP